MAIYFTGDLHGQFSRFFDPEFLLHIDDYRNCTPERDVVIAAGDFGGVWQNEKERGSYMYEHAEKELDKLDSLPFTIAFIDGNHENFPRLDSYPEEQKFCGLVNRIRGNIFRLRQRGHIYEILGKKLLCFGGAVSFDQGRRKEGLSWWPQERSDDGDYISCINSLAAVGRKVDYVLTHISPIEAMDYLGDQRTIYWRGNQDLLNISDPMPAFLQFVAERMLFSRWYFGHSHYDEPFEIATPYGSRKYRALYHGCVKAAEETGGEEDLKLQRT